MLRNFCEGFLVCCWHVSMCLLLPCLWVDKRLQSKRDEKWLQIYQDAEMGEIHPLGYRAVRLPPRRPITPPLLEGIPSTRTDPQTACALFTKLPYELREEIWIQCLSNCRFHMLNDGHMKVFVCQNQVDFPWRYPHDDCPLEMNPRIPLVPYTSQLLALPLTCRLM